MNDAELARRQLAAALSEQRRGVAQVRDVAAERGAKVRRGGPQSAMHARQSMSVLRSTMEAGVEEVVGFVPVIGVGELVLETNFPVMFTGPVAIYGGGAVTTPADAPNTGDLRDQVGLVIGNFPTWSVGVAAWRTKKISGVGVTYGAVLVFVVTGPDTMESVVNWTVRGTALKNPVELD